MPSYHREMHEPNWLMAKIYLIANEYGCEVIYPNSTEGKLIPSVKLDGEDYIIDDGIIYRKEEI